ncbi:hypothetical protein NLL33_05575 [Corynebacterium accolens]|uniref:hypothetical protein n=1 Tax=Corynebacterium accolens TaxID=38284 RepID=UPI00266F84E3|nr:hypothetical protein [Corynebacterium accolens]WKS67994.1 hypothetical protein NLL33_05575 [Corynebacterium accolens]
MSVYLRRDIDYLLAPYSYDQLFLKLPFDYAVEAAARSHVFHTPLDTANSYWSQQYVNIDTTVDDLPHALPGRISRVEKDLHCHGRAHSTGCFRRI